MPFCSINFMIAEYGRLAGSSGVGGNKPFQNLLFLVRDWQYVQDAGTTIILFSI